ncbi:MAG: UDP-N-acetylglucosamine 1-carboxyvinyltransferase, partial [Planctomycetota bacterium]
MDIFEIDGPVQLSGTIDVAGSKNSTLPVMAAMLLAPGTSTIANAPDLADIRSLETLLTNLGAKVNRDEGGLHINATVIDNPVGEYEIVRKMRASICILGPLLARCGKVKVSMPGGCAIGDRPVDIHLRGAKALGAKIHLENGYI